MNNTNHTYYDNHTNAAERQIWLDMDGTFVDLYGVENWCERLNASDPSPYMEAKPLINLSAFARVLNNKQRQGWTINIVSWTSKSGTTQYQNHVCEIKKAWLKIHLKSVHFDNIHIIPYGEPKHNGRKGILFDDNASVRAAWGENAFDVQDLIQSIRGL